MNLVDFGALSPHCNASVKDFREWCHLIATTRLFFIPGLEKCRIPDAPLRGRRHPAVVAEDHESNRVGFDLFERRLRRRRDRLARALPSAARLLPAALPTEVRYY